MLFKLYKSQSQLYFSASSAQAAVRRPQRLWHLSLTAEATWAREKVMSRLMFESPAHSKPPESQLPFSGLLGFGQMSPLSLTVSRLYVAVSREVSPLLVFGFVCLVSYLHLKYTGVGLCSFLDNWRDIAVPDACHMVTASATGWCLSLFFCLVGDLNRASALPLNYIPSSHPPRFIKDRVLALARWLSS